MFFIGIIEDNKDVVQQITEFFLAKDGYSLLFVCASLEEYKALSLAKKNKASIILIDAGENNFDRLWQTKYLKQVNPEFRIFLVAEVPIREYFISKLLQAGAEGLLSRNQLEKDLLLYFGKLLNGKPKLPLITNGKPDGIPAGRRPLTGKDLLLTPREFEIVELVIKGYTNKKIGQVMYISTYTVNAHLRKIYIKCAVRSRTELISRIIDDLV